MPKVLQIVEGDGISSDAFALMISIPDSAAGTVLVDGTATAKGLATVTVTGNDALPAVPTSGLVYFNLQLDPITGSVTMQQSTSAQPPASLASDGVNFCRIIYADVLSPTSVNPAYDSGSTAAGPVAPTFPNTPIAPTSPPAISSSVSDITFVQSTPAAMWTIVHNLDHHPSVTILDATNHLMFGDVTYPVLSTVVIAFSQPLTGTVYLA